MSKSNYFTGQPILNQILQLATKSDINHSAKSLGSDRYYKYFDTYNHLVTMLYCTFNRCTSSREVCTGYKACENKLHHLGIKKGPGKSTLCDANKNRDSKVFMKIYKTLHQKYKKSLPDSRKPTLRNNFYIIDSSTITLFQEILKATGRPPINGKKKGGIKVHTLINTREDVPMHLKFTSAAASDVPFLQDLDLHKGAVVVFDKGYNDYAEYNKWSKDGMFFVTRIRENAKIEITESKILSSYHQKKGILKDQQVIIGHTHNKKAVRVRARMVTHQSGKKIFRFLTNNFQFSPVTIAGIYKDRWQIELLFKRVKQNFPLKYFLGDNQNAIEIQIWCAFIADLLLKVIQAKVKRKWAYSNLVSIVRLHLFSYIDLTRFLNNPDGIIRSKLSMENSLQLTIFETEGLGFKT